jgi:hypothetical protein
MTATLAKTAFFSIPLPAYMVGPNDVIQVTAYFSGNGTHNKTATIAYGGVDYGAVTAVDVLKIQTFIRQKNSTSSQAASALGPISGLSTLNTGSVDVTTNQSITFSGTLTDGGETLTLLYYNIQVRRVFDTILRIARRTLSAGAPTILLVGETGTGKEETVVSEMGRFRCVEARNHGFVRISKKDKFCFENHPNP